MDTQVELYHAGMVSLKEFIDMPYDNDILVALHVAKKPIRIAYLSQRNTATDFRWLPVQCLNMMAVCM